MNPFPPTLRPASWTPAIRMGLSIAVATGLYGISFGALAVAAGLTVWQAMAANKRVYACNLVCTVPSIKSVFTWSVGIMKSGAPFPSLEKVLAATTWTFDFQDFEKSSL